MYQVIIHRSREGGGGGEATVLRPPLWDILLRISLKQLFFLNIRPLPQSRAPPFRVSLYAPEFIHSPSMVILTLCTLVHVFLFP